MIKNSTQYCLLLAVLLLNNCLFAQKKLIDSSVFGKWPTANSPRLSNDGNYVANTSPSENGSKTTLRSVKTGWKINLEGEVEIAFANDDHHYLFLKNDSLVTGTLGNTDVSYQTGISSFKLFDKGNKNNWLVCRMTSSPLDLLLYDLEAGEKKRYASVQNYWLSPDGDHLVLQTVANDQLQLQYIDLATNQAKTIWEGKQIGNLITDGTINQLAFLVADEANKKTNTIWYYKAGVEKAVILINKNLPEIEDKFNITKINAISKNGDGLFFSLQEKEQPLIKPALLPVDIWSYKDTKLQSEQLLAKRHVDQYTAVFNISEHRMFMLEKQGIKLMTPVEKAAQGYDYVLVNRAADGIGEYGGGEWNWNPHAKLSVCLMSLKDGSLQPICKDLEDIRTIYLCQLSSEGKYVVYYDSPKGGYFSYNIANRHLHNLTHFVKANWTSYTMDDYPNLMPIGIAGFLQNDEAVLINDQHDIYQFDLSDKRSPICLTNHYGVKHNIVFRIASMNKDLIVAKTDRLLTSAFNRTTKDNGFCHIQMGLPRDPQDLKVYPYAFDGADGTEFQPIKSKDAAAYIIKRMSASESPNYFLTTDFRKLEPLTSNYPERDYNWLKSELVTWKTPDGKTDQGILYKPENFDPNKKYPLIINYYEKISDELNFFLLPEFSYSDINIPYYVSNGYLVFTPDIHFKLGSPGRSSYNCVVSGARFLSRRPYIDSKRIGLQGHSFGGFQTNYIVTHSKLFAAAISGSGMSDFVSIYNSNAQGSSRQGQYENSRDRMGATLWQMPQNYIENSPVLLANQVLTPILLMANKGDTNVPYEQGFEFFIALRRLEKKCWMLQYDEQGHMPNGKASEDYTIRMKQFFDHYLKDTPPPSWMTKGVPAKLKGIDSGLALDTSGAKP